MSDGGHQLTFSYFSQGINKLLTFKEQQLPDQERVESRSPPPPEPTYGLIPEQRQPSRSSQHRKGHQPRQKQTRTMKVKGGSAPVSQHAFSIREERRSPIISSAPSSAQRMVTRTSEFTASAPPATQKSPASRTPSAALKAPEQEQAASKKRSGRRFALCHHFVVWCAAEEENPGRRFRDYALLGDDIVIGDPAVAARYRPLPLTVGGSLFRPTAKILVRKTMRMGVEVASLPFQDLALSIEKSQDRSTEPNVTQKKRKQKEAKEASTHCFAKCASGQRIGDLRKRARLLSYKKLVGSGVLVDDGSGGEEKEEF
ncbi:conserved hypothetical protein [Ricinus communis]|uniref:Uncharacterized protein n=1 Tax=Ricinus communis TaxID=3988 RepID=B9TA22_RICCO|nr:conserved hypothetical protein [Ricinus communis]